MTLYAACSPGEIRVAAVHDGTLIDYAIWRPGRPDGVGDVHLGRVVSIVPAMAGAFVAIAGAEGFLPDSAGAAGRGVGDILTVEVVRAAQGGKGPRLKTISPPEKPSPSGSGPENGEAPRLLQHGASALERMAAMHPGPIMIEDPAITAQYRPLFAGRLRTAAMPAALAAAIDALGDPVAILPGGLRATIEPTAALVAIDLDTAAATGNRAPKAAMQEAANRAALPALARQIRLRNLSGAILVDLAGLTIRRRSSLADDLRAALAPDPAGPRLLGFTAGGLAEIQRPRIHPPLHELLAGPHAAGLAALRRIATDADPARPPRLCAAPDVVTALEQDPVALPALAHQLGRPLVMRSDPALPPCAWRIEERPCG